MKLVLDLKTQYSSCLIVSGDGKREFKIMEIISKVYDGETKILWFPKAPLGKKAGLSALDSIKLFAEKFQLFCCIIDGEFIREDAKAEIHQHLQDTGFENVEIDPLQGALLAKCKVGSHHIQIFCVISGPKTCIEEEIQRLIELELQVTIDTPGARTKEWKDHLKNEITRVLRGKGKKLKKLLEEASQDHIERAFPNFCAVLKALETFY